MSFDNIGELNSETEYEDISDVNIFKDKRSDKSLNKTNKISIISTVVLRSEPKSSVSSLYLIFVLSTDMNLIKVLKNEL